MALITAQVITDLGLTPAYTAVSASDTFVIPQSEDRHFLHVKNSGGVSLDVTITAVKTSVKVAGAGTLPISDKVITIPAGQELVIGPFPEAFIASTGIVTVDYSVTASVLAGVFKLPKT